MDEKSSEYENLANLHVALDGLIDALEEPMEIAVKIEDKNLRLMIGELSAYIIGKIDYEIKPALNKLCQ